MILGWLIMHIIFVYIIYVCHSSVSKQGTRSTHHILILTCHCQLIQLLSIVWETQWKTHLLTLLLTDATLKINKINNYFVDSQFSQITKTKKYGVKYKEDLVYIFLELIQTQYNSFRFSSLICNYHVAC